jgi:hypothetical protein
VGIGSLRPRFSADFHRPRVGPRTRNAPRREPPTDSFLFVLYIVSFLDRVNVGFAALEMNRDLRLSPAVYSASICSGSFSASQKPASSLASFSISANGFPPTRVLAPSRDS